MIATFWKIYRPLQKGILGKLSLYCLKRDNTLLIKVKIPLKDNRILF